MTSSIHLSPLESLTLFRTSHNWRFPGVFDTNSSASRLRFHPKARPRPLPKQGATKAYIRLSKCITPEPRQPNTGRSQKSSVGLALCALPASPLVIEPCRTGEQTFNCGVVHEGDYYPRNTGFSSQQVSFPRPVLQWIVEDP